jgi:hypothetical protein
MCNLDDSWKKKAKELQAELDSLKTPFPDPAFLMSAGKYRDVCRAASLFKDDLSEIYIPDIENKTYWKEDIVEYLELNQVDKIIYVPETMDCDDFARELFGYGLSLIWTDVHALNYFITPEGVLYYVEPQNDLVSVNIEGMHIRFFIGA